ncbi:MAG: hypothetical protein IJI61_03435 [Oscillospiraceae bacterium]|nr:hypothetical protein [Oscillospiraceae bacterium]
MPLAVNMTQDFIKSEAFTSLPLSCRAIYLSLLGNVYRDGTIKISPQKSGGQLGFGYWNFWNCKDALIERGLIEYIGPATYRLKPVKGVNVQNE